MWWLGRPWEVFDSILVFMKSLFILFGTAHEGGALSSWNMATSERNSVCTAGCTESCKMASYSSAAIRPCIAIIRPNDPHEMAAAAITDPAPYLTAGKRHWGSKASSIGFLQVHTYPDVRKRIKHNSPHCTTFPTAPGSRFCAPYTRRHIVHLYTGLKYKRFPDGSFFGTLLIASCLPLKKAI